VSTIWYTSDTHFNHKLVAKKRGFTRPLDACGEPDHFNPCNLCAPGDPGAHDQVILGNWNKLVKPGDRAYILGDFAMNWKGADELLAQMNGDKILICGNHDIMSGVHADGWKHRAGWTGEGRFAAIMDVARRKVAGREFLMSHYPYTGDHTERDRYLQYRLRDYGMWLLHGHTHLKNRMSGNRQVHVGMDAWGLCPVPEKRILALVDGEEERQRALDSRRVAV